MDGRTNGFWVALVLEWARERLKRVGEGGPWGRGVVGIKPQ